VHGAAFDRHEECAQAAWARTRDTVAFEIPRGTPARVLERHVRRLLETRPARVVGQCDRAAEVRAATKERHETPISLAGQEHRCVPEWSRRNREANLRRSSCYEPVRPDRRGTAVTRAAGHDQTCDGKARQRNQADGEANAKPSSEPSGTHPVIVPDLGHRIEATRSAIPADPRSPICLRTGTMRVMRTESGG
jgi:hypothetical protein